MIKSDSIEVLKSVIDIVDVVSSYIEIKKVGANYKSTCPFHVEKTPSFVVSPNRQIYHCFGCHASGDAIKFVQEFEKISYPEAIEKLAAMYNFKLEYDTDKSGGGKKSEILERFNDFFKKSFEANDDAKKYIVERGVFASTLEKFEIGYAPSSNTQLEFLKRNFLPIADAIEYGMLGEDNGRIYSRMQERITFPIKNQNGKIIGFGGRTISNHPVKYINSPQTKIFNKSKIFYGLHLAKEQIKRQKSMIVCEGYMDVIMLHQAGFSNVVAVLGTALTKEHLPIIKKLECKVVLAFDSDKAGQNAAIKSARVLLEHSVDGGVAIFDSGMDPADMVRASKIEELARIFNKTKPFMEFLLEEMVKKYDLSNPLQKERALNEIKELFASVSAIFADTYRPLAAALLKLPLTMLKKSGKKEEFVAVQKYDPAESSAIKSMLYDPLFLDMALNRIDARMFEYHRDIFLLIASGELGSPKLLEIEGNDKISLMSKEEFVSFLISKNIVFYDKIISKIKLSKSMSAAEKSFYLKKVMRIKEELKKGNLIEADTELLTKIHID